MQEEAEGDVPERVQDEVRMKLHAEEIGRRYDEAATAHEMWRPLKELAGIGRMRRRLLSRVRGEVLEVAVGTGASLRHYPLNHASDMTLAAVDISPGMLGLARREARRLGIELDARVMDAERLEHPANRFDTVICAFSVCTFPDPEAALGEMRRVCRLLFEPAHHLLLVGGVELIETLHRGPHYCGAVRRKALALE